MADKKISVLNAATTIFDADDFAVVQDGETKQANASVVKTYVKDGLSKSDVGLGNVDNTSDATKNSATVTLTNKTISGSSNTLSDIGNTSLTNSSITINGNAVSLGGSTTVTATASNALTLGTGLTGTSYNGSSAVTAAIDTSVVTTLTGTQTLTNKTISGANNTLSNIGNSSLTNSAITFGATSQALGSTVSALNAVSIGGTTAAAGAFTTLSASSTVSGTGFSTYLASPPAIGGTTPAAGNFTTLGATGNVTLGDASTDTLTINGTAVSIPNNLNFDSNTLFIDATNNRVGLGTATPGSKLTVLTTTNDGIFVSDGTINTVLYNSGGTTGSIGTLTNHSLAFYTNNTSKMLLTAGGYLGIGASSPSTTLDVNGTIRSTSQVVPTSGSGIELIGGTGTNYLIAYNRTTPGFLPLSIQGSSVSIFGSSTTGLTVESSGNVVVGSGGASTSPTVYINGGNTGANGPAIFGQAASSNEWLICSLRGAAGAGAGLGGLVDYVYGAYPRVFYTNGAERLRIDSSGNVGIGVTPNTGYNACLQLKSGITFPATQVTSSNANTLDDYEEGTWTPSVGGTATYTIQDAYYVKIGKVVYVMARFLINVIGTGSTSTISGLPFVSANTFARCEFAVGQCAGLATSLYSLTLEVPNNTSTIIFQGRTAAGNQTDVSAALGNNSDIYFSGFYFVG